MMRKCFQSLDRIKRSKVRIKVDSMEVGEGPMGLGVGYPRWRVRISIAFQRETVEFQIIQHVLGSKSLWFPYRRQVVEKYDQFPYLSEKILRWTCRCWGKTCTLSVPKNPGKAKIPGVGPNRPRTPPKWRNGRRAGLKILCPQGRVGSTPTFGTSTLCGRRRFRSLLNIL